jgi:hypothetical protein
MEAKQGSSGLHRRLVYVVFTSDGVAKLVYRGTEGLVEVYIDIKARVFGTTTYRAVAITSVIEDKNGQTDGITSTSHIRCANQGLLERH